MQCLPRCQSVAGADNPFVRLFDPWRDSGPLPQSYGLGLYPIVSLLTTPPTARPDLAADEVDLCCCCRMKATVVQLYKRRAALDIVIDTSAIIAVVTNEPHRQRLIELTAGAGLIVPPSVPWEIGNAFSAMFRQKRISLRQALLAVRLYKKIPLRISEVDLRAALELAHALDVYAYDAYVIACARKHRADLLSLDRGLIEAAARAGVGVLEVEG